MEDANRESEGNFGEILDLDLDSVSAEEYKDYDDEQFIEIDDLDESEELEETLDIDLLEGPEDVEIVSSEQQPKVLVNSKQAQLAFAESLNLLSDFRNDVNTIVNTVTCAESESQDLAKFSEDVLEGKPSFITRDQALRLQKNIHSQAYNPDVNNPNLYEGTGIEYNNLSGVDLIVLDSFVQNSLNKLEDRVRNQREKVSKLENYKKAYRDVLLDGISQDYNEIVKTIEGFKPVILQKLKLSPKSLSYICPCCGKEYKLDVPLVTFIVTDTNGRDCLPAIMYCKDCKVVIQLSKKQIAALKSCIVKGSDGFRFKSNSRYQSCCLYSLSNSQIFDKLGSVCEMVDSDDDDLPVEEMNVNWEALCKDFMKMQELYHQETSVKSDCVGISGIAKILAEQNDSYVELKEKALASLIQEIKSLNIPEFSEYSIRVMEIPKFYKNKINEYWNNMLYLIPTNVNDETLKSGKFTKDDFLKDYEKYCNETDPRGMRDVYVNKLSEYAVSLGNIPISSSIRLSDEDKQDYLSYKPLRDVLDEISDLMIINHCSESYLNFYYPRTSSVSSPHNNGSYNFVKRAVIDVSKKGSMAKKIKDYVKFFNNLAGTNLLNSDNFVLTYCSSYELFNAIAIYCKSLLSLDFYNASKQRDYLIENFRDEINVLILHPRFEVLLEILTKFPKIETKDEFDYYFGANKLEYTQSQKDALLDLRKKKFLVPKVLKGDTFEEQFNYYNSLEGFGDVELVQDENSLKFLKDYKIAIKAMSFCDYRESFDDLIMYNLSRDLFIELSKLDLKTLCKVLYLNENICPIFLNKEYNYEDRKFDVTRLIKDLPYKDESLKSLMTDTMISEIEFKNSMSQNVEALMWESEVSPEVKEIIETYLNKINKEG